MKEWIELYIQKKQSPDTKKVSEFCFLNYIILQTISIIRMATDELPCSAKWLIRLVYVKIILNNALYSTSFLCDVNSGDAVQHGVFILKE